VLNIPTGSNPVSPVYPPAQVGSTYVIQWGDTLGDIAVKYGVSLSDILAVNLQIWNASLIFPGQVINLPANVNVPPSTNYPSTNNPYNCNPSPYNPSACDSTNYNPPNCNPSPFNHYACDPYNNTPANSPLYSNLKVTSGPGLLVRAGPGMNFIEIRSPFVSAVNNSEWRFRKNSVTIDSTGLVWVEVTLSQQVNGFSTGWIMVRDQLGTHFTDPNIDPDP
jgi:LysM domain